MLKVHGFSPYKNLFCNYSPFVCRVIFAVVLSHREVKKISDTTAIGTKRKSNRTVNTPKGEAQLAWWEGTQEIKL